MPRYTIEITVPITADYEVEVEAPNAEIATEAAESMLIGMFVDSRASIVNVDKADESVGELDIIAVTEITEAECK